MKRLFLPILVTLSMFTVSCDKDSVTNPDDVPVSVTESELKEAFYYTFPLMIMDATESVETNTETFVPGIPRAPVNQLIHAVKLADASNKSVVTPNVDTYYSRLWMDMNEEPVVFEFPDVKDRFCNIQVLDAWTNTRRDRRSLFPQEPLLWKCLQQWAGVLFASLIRERATMRMSRRFRMQ